VVLRGVLQALHGQRLGNQPEEHGPVAPPEESIDLQLPKSARNPAAP
jgi:hypothetical protein